MVEAVVADLKKLLRTGEERGFKSASVLEAIRLYLDRHGCDARDESMFFEPTPVASRKRARSDQHNDGTEAERSPSSLETVQGEQVRQNYDQVAETNSVGLGKSTKKNKHDPVAAYAIMSLEDLTLRLSNAKGQLEQIHESFRDGKMFKTVYTMNVARYGKRIGQIEAELSKRQSVSQ